MSVIIKIQGQMSVKVKATVEIRVKKKKHFNVLNCKNKWFIKYTGTVGKEFV